MILMNSSRVDRAFRNAALTAAGLTLVYLMVVFGMGDSYARMVVSDIYTPLIDLLAVAGLFLAVRATPKASRLKMAWSLLFVGQLFNLFGDVTWSVYEIGLNQLPYPSLADVFYLLGMLILLIGLFLIPPKLHSLVERTKNGIDATIIIIASVLFYWNFILGPQLQQNMGDPLLVQALILAYPAFDLLQFWVFLSLVYHHAETRHRLPVFLLGLALITNVMTNTVFSYQAISKTFVSGGLLDTGWIASSLLFALAGLSQYLANIMGSEKSHTWLATNWVRRIINSMAVILPYIWLAGTFGLLLVSYQQTLPMGFTLIFIAVGVMVGLVLLRQALALFENHSLMKKLENAMAQVQAQAEELEINNLSLLLEVEERKRAEEQLAYDALHDDLTGLSNRVYLIDRLQMAIDQTRREGSDRYSLLFLDLDQFKVINDSVGHITGDQLLVALADLLRSILRSSDTIARLGGDEFVVLLDTYHHELTDIQVASRILESLNQPFRLNGNNLYTTTSIGIVPSLIGYTSPSDVLRDADIALYQAKDRGKACFAVFDLALRTQAMKRLVMENEVRSGIERGEFDLRYQPIFDLKANILTSFEALVRWNHPVRGLVPPDEFLPVCEDSGLIYPLSKLILYQACAQMQAWRTAFPGYSKLAVAVNISGKQMSQPDFYEQIVEALKITGLAADGLVLEITENVMIDNLVAVEKILLQLYMLGVRMQIDDFGTGYSSINYLSYLPISTIKIDKSFVQGIGSSTRMSNLVRTMLRMAHDLDLEAIAEGIETQTQLDALQENDCPMGQGYMFARPLDPSAVLDLLKTLISEPVSAVTLG